MTSPGGVEVGRVSVRVVPDTSRFLAQAKKELKTIAKQLKVEIPLLLDTSKISEELKKAKARADDTKAKMGVEVDGDGVARETRRIRRIAQALVGAIKMTVGLNVPASVARIKVEMKVIQKVVQGYNIRIPIEFVGLSKWLAILGSISALLLTIPHLVGAIGGAVNYVAGALALLPALIAGAAFGIGALVVGFQGFGEALSNAGDPAKFEESLQKLTPAAQDAARALAEFREPLIDIRKAVQESLFKGMADPLRDLKALLPPIKSGLTGSAAGIREMTKAWIEMATSQKSIEDTQTIADNVSRMFEQMRPAAANFGQAMRDITVVGSTFLPRLGTAVSEITGKFADWATKARETGRLDEMINNFIDKTKQLGRIIADVTAGFRNIFTSMTGGEEFLDIIERITQGFREWSEAKETQETLARLANVMRTVADAAWTLFSQVFKSAGQILKDLEPFLLTLAQGIGLVLAGAIRAITPLLQGLARFLSENRAIMVPLAIAIIAMVTAFKLAVTAAGFIIKLRDSFLALRAASVIIGEVGTNVANNCRQIIRSIRGAIVASSQWVYSWIQVGKQAVIQAAKASAAWISSAAKSASFTARYYGIMAAQAISAWVKMAAAAVVNAVKITATWIANLARMIAVQTAQMATAVALWVANWVRMAAVALANAARMALAWLIAMGPIGLIIAAIVALVALIIANWDTILAVTKAVWDAIWSAIKWVIGLIIDILGSIWDAVLAVIGWFIDMGQGIIDGIQKGLDWLGDIKDKILKFFADAGKWLWETGKNLVQGLWDGWKSYFDDFEAAVKKDGSGLIDQMNSVFKIFSPSRVFRRIGEYLGQGLEIGLHSSMLDATKEAVALGRGLTAALDKNLFVPTDWAQPIADSVPDALASLDTLMDATSAQATAQWTGQIKADELQPLEDRVLAALATGLRVELDGRQVTKSVNANNLSNLRRK